MLPKIITQTDVYKERSEFNHYSVSKLKMYSKCSEMYYLQYIEKMYTYKESTSTFIGTLMHATLEYLYGEDDDSVESALDAFYRILIPEFQNAGIMDAEAILGDLLDYNEDISQLYLRASESYEGDDAIRTKSGKVPKAPEMTGIWKEECRRLDLNSRKSRIDQVIQDSKTGFEEVSITDVFAKAYQIAAEYYTPEEIEEILYLELPLSKWDYKNQRLINAVPFPNCKHEHKYMSGYIDNVCKIRVNGKIYTAVVDYKTSKEEFNENMVAHNQQLLSYVAGVEALTDLKIDYIGILSFTQKKLIYAPVDRQLMEEVFVNYNKVIDAEIAGAYIKHVPDTKYSPCLDSFGHTCPFLEHCWPSTFEFLENKKVNADEFLPYLT